MNVTLIAIVTMVVIVVVVTVGVIHAVEMGVRVTVLSRSFVFGLHHDGSSTIPFEFETVE